MYNMVDNTKWIAKMMGSLHEVLASTGFKAGACSQTGIDLCTRSADVRRGGCALSTKGMQLLAELIAILIWRL
jgi:hypothetical protein